MKAASAIRCLSAFVPRAMACLFLVAGALAPAAVAEETSTVPAFVGYLGSSQGGALFAVKWKAANGSWLQAWCRIGQHAGEFKLVSFDPAAEVLVLEDGSGRRFQLSLPDGKVREKLSEQEFSGLMKFMLHGADTTDAPVLSREKAREFFLLMVEKFTPPGTDVILDVNGSTLPPSRQATWESDKARARSFDRLLLATVKGGKGVTHDLPRKPFNAPEPMTRNLIDSDWDEIALLHAISTLKSVPQRKAK